MRLVLVSAAVLIDPDQNILVSERPITKSWAGYWEFPGGKIELDETPEQALIRELHEELGITVKPHHLAPLTFVSFDYAKFHLLMPLYAVREWQGLVRSKENQALQWVSLEKLKKIQLLPADLPIIPVVERYVRQG
jgi:8-oxo-dGTP diphosphatase